MPASVSEAHFALTMEWRLSHRKRLFDAPISNGRYPPRAVFRFSSAHDP
jgi:hypothetical protein